MYQYIKHIISKQCNKEDKRVFFYNQPPRYYVSVSLGFFLIFVLNTFSGTAQSHQFSQYYAVPLYVNPANAGIEEDIYFGLNYRVQRLSGLAYKTGKFTSILPIYMQGQEKKHVGGLGVAVTSDMSGQANEVKQLSANFSGAYNIQLNVYNSQMLSFGLQGEYKQTSIDYGKLDWASQIAYNGFAHTTNPGDAFRDQVSFMAFNAGVIWSYNSNNRKKTAGDNYKLNLGFSVANINEPDQSFIGNETELLPVFYKIHGRGDFDLSDIWSISPDFLVMMQHQNQQYNVGALLSYTKFKEDSQWDDTGLDMRFGTWYRLQDSFVLMLGAGNEIFNASISYDINAMQERTNFAGQSSLELFLSYRIQTDNNLKQIGSPLK